MLFSPQQDKALVAVDEWLRTGEQQVFRLFGYAGTGKTTLARHLAESVSGQVLFAAYTGKAAHVLRQKGCQGASTIHSLIYEVRNKSMQRLRELEEALALEEGKEEPDEKLVARYKREISRETESLRQPAFRLMAGKRESEDFDDGGQADRVSDVVGAKLVVIDECSMVNTQMAEDLLSFGTKVLVLGDPAQLPPVAGAGYFTECRPDFMLTEIHRQAEGNPIIAMATKVRKGEKLTYGSYGDSRVLPNFDEEMLLACDQLLAGRNNTRKSVNNTVRKLKGITSVLPVPGDRLVCLRNNHELGLMNGALWNVKAIEYEVKKGPMLVELTLTSTDDAKVETSTHAHRHYFQGAEPPLHIMGMADHFDYGYALTTHKSQGSQWPHVLVIDESSCFREHRDRWLYTAITRASERVDVIRA